MRIADNRNEVRFMKDTKDIKDLKVKIGVQCKVMTTGKMYGIFSFLLEQGFST